MKKRLSNSKGRMPKGFGWPKERRRAAATALHAARALLEKRGELATGELAWDVEAREVSPMSPQAVTWCSLGAICHVTRSPSYGESHPMRKAARDAMFVLGKMYESTVRTTGEAANAVYNLNDGIDHGEFQGMTPLEHLKHVLGVFEKAEKVLR